MAKGSIWPPLTFILLIFVFTIPFFFASTGAIEVACISFVVLFFLLIFAFLKSRVSTEVLSMYDEDEEEYDDEYEAYPEGNGYASTPDLEYRDFDMKSTYSFLSDYNLEEEMYQIKTSKDRYGSYDTSLRRAKIINLLDSHDLLTAFIYEVWPQGESKIGNKRIEFFRNLYFRFVSSEGALGSTVSDSEYEIENISENIQILRGTEFVRGFVRVKIAVVNDQDTSITDASLKLIYDRDSLRLDHIEPSLDNRGDDILMGTIQPLQKKTVAVYLDPQICTTSTLKGVLHYHDAKGDLKTELLPPKNINVVCPLLFTRETANPARLRNLVENELELKDNKAYQIPPGMQLQRAFDIVRAIMSGRDIKFVREITYKDQYEAWYYGITKVKKHQLVMCIFVLEGKVVIEVHTASSKHSELTGILAELGHDIEERLKEHGYPVQQITNINIKDSILNRSPLLFSELDGEIDINDSVVSRSSIDEGEPADDVGEASPPAATDEPSYDPKTEKTRNKAEVKMAKKTRTKWPEKMDIVCLQLYLYNKKYNWDTKRPHIPLKYNIPTIERMFDKVDKFDVQVRGFAKFDPLKTGATPPKATKQQERIWFKSHNMVPEKLTRKANDILKNWEKDK